MEPKVIARNNARLDFELHENHPLRLRHARGRKIEALNGTLWITSYNELADIELVPGQKFVVPTDRLTLVEPIGRGAVRIEQPASLGSTLRRLLASLTLPRTAKKECASPCLSGSSH